MREKIARAPRWAVQLASGAFWTAWMTVVGVAMGAGLATSAAAAAPGGVLFGLVGGYFFHRVNRQTLAVTGDRVPNRAVRRAIWRGPVPTGPEDRQQALALVDLQLHQLRWSRPLSLGLAGLLAAGFVTGAAFSPPAPWIALGGAAVLAALAEIPYRIARRRRTVLTGPAGVGVEH